MGKLVEIAHLRKFLDESGGDILMYLLFSRIFRKNRPEHIVFPYFLLDFRF